jgi:hypothetical protein
VTFALIRPNWLTQVGSSQIGCPIFRPAFQSRAP